MHVQLDSGSRRHQRPNWWWRALLISSPFLIRLWLAWDYDVPVRAEASPTLNPALVGPISHVRIPTSGPREKLDLMRREADYLSKQLGVPIVADKDVKTLELRRRP